MTGTGSWSDVPRITTVDYHTGGEPFRIVTGGAPDLPGDDVLDRRARAGLPGSAADRVRRLLCHEPRGHTDMYGCFLVPPDTVSPDTVPPDAVPPGAGRTDSAPPGRPGAHFGALFWHKDGFSTACGHGTIALGVHAVREGLVEADPDGDTDVVVDVPSGRVTARVRSSRGRIEAVTFVSVPSYVLARAVPADGVSVDLAYGGAVYAGVPARALGLEVRPEHLTGLIAAARRIKAALHGHPATLHPGDDRLSGVYGVIFHEPLPGRDGEVHQRNVTVFADGEVDRSPCGSGTAARLALLHDEGVRDPLVHHSIVGSVFRARVAGVTGAGIVPEIEGMAYRTGRHVFELDPDDPMGTGFALR